MSSVLALAARNSLGLEVVYQRSILIIDANNFYISCQRVFDPRLWGVPVVVVSNNDGCAIARSEEAKVLGIKMGEPLFKMRDLIKQHRMIVLSSNYPLYADISNRFMAILAEYAPLQEVYSIDECFLDMTGVAGDHTQIAREIKARIWQDIRLPVCVGAGPSKTLAKLANHIAKKNPQFAGVYNFNDHSAEVIDERLSNIGTGEIWGVGRRLVPRLAELNINTVLQLKQADTEYLRQQFSVVMEKTIRELNGVMCIEMEEVAAPKKEIISSRSFGYRVRDLESLEEAVSMYMSRAAEKLRLQNGFAHSVRCFIQTSPHGEGAKYASSRVIGLPAPTNDTRQLVKVALYIMRYIYKEGFEYIKCGVGLLDIVDSAGQQSEMFGFKPTHDSSIELMNVLDQINNKMGKNVLRVGAMGYNAPWAMKQEHLSPCYTTRWEDILVVKD